MPTTLEHRLSQLKSHLRLLPETKEPPPTILQVIGRSRQESDWQRLLFHFLSPDEAHGLEYALLEHLLVALSEREDLDFTFSSFELMDTRIQQEVSTSQGRPDAVLWSAEDWFICWELKIDASEANEQTQAYVDVETFYGIDLVKDQIPPEGHYYIYLAPAGANQPEANEFVPISWGWMAAELQSFLAKSHEEYPARTTAQLNDFIGTIRSELTMTGYNKNQQDKAELFLDYYDEIAEVRDAFETQWEYFTNNWGTQLAQTLDSVETVEDANVPDPYVTLEIETQDGLPQRWILRQGKTNWGGILKQGWWKRTDDGSNIYDLPDDEMLAGLSFYHRLQRNRQLAIEDRTLQIEFWHSTSNSGRFIKRFNRNFAEIGETMEGELALATDLSNISDRQKKLFTLRYDIRTDSYDDFFQAYIGALKEAFLELCVENDSLLTAIDHVYEQSFDMYREDWST